LVLPRNYLTLNPGRESETRHVGGSQGNVTNELYSFD